MTSLSIEGVQVLSLTSTLLGEGSVLSACCLQLGFGFDLPDLSLLLSISYEGGGCRLRLIHDLHNLGLNLSFNSVLLTLDLSDEDSADLLGLDDADLLVSLRAHPQLVLLHTGSLDLRLQVLHLSIILSLHVGQLLILRVLQGQLLVAILLDVVCQHVLALGLLLEGLSEGLVDVYVGDVAVLEDDAEELKLMIQVLDHLLSHLTLQVEHLTQPDAVNEESDTLVYLGVEEFIETAGAQAVHEILDLDFLGWHAEREVQIDVYVGIVLGGAVMNLAIMSVIIYRIQGRCSSRWLW